MKETDEYKLGSLEEAEAFAVKRMGRAYDNGYDSGLPTPQTKPLSDERLQEIYKKVYEEGHDNQVVALARAIEKEHGIL